MAGETERVDLTSDEREELRWARYWKRPRLPCKVLARQLGVSHVTLWRWQRGERRPTLAQLRAWWKAVGP